MKTSIPGIFSIRELRPSDRPEIEAMLTKSGFFPVEEVKVALELIDTGIRNPTQEDYIFVVAEHRKKVAGYVCYGWNSMTEGTWDIYWICVSPDLKNQGVGKDLMAFTEKQVKNKKGSLIIVETSGRELYHSTRAFYLKLGYVEEGRIKDFYHKGDDRVIYTKRF